MKKFFSILAIAVVALASCNKENGKTDGPSKGEQTGSTEIIAIDGEFADWGAVKDAVVVNCDPEVSTAVNVMKVVSDAENMYVYAEVAVELVSSTFDPSDVWGAHGPTPFRLIMDLDNDAATGGTDPHWDALAGYDALMDTYIYNDGGEIKLAFSQWWDFTGTPGDPIIGNYKQITDDDDNHIVTAVAGVVEAGYAKFEFAVAQDMLKGLEGKNIVIGAYMYPVDWAAEKALPVAAEVTLK